VLARQAADLIARTRAEALLRASEERQKRVLETDAVGVLFFDKTEGTPIDANDAFLKMTGYSRQDVESRKLHWQTMTPPEWLAKSKAQMDLLAQTGRIGPYQKEYLHKNGSRTWMLFAGRDLDDGTIVGFAIDTVIASGAQAELLK
jgi:PAS domain S-box-containing protein